MGLAAPAEMEEPRLDQENYLINPLYTFRLQSLLGCSLTNANGKEIYTHYGFLFLGVFIEPSGGYRLTKVTEKARPREGNQACLIKLCAGHPRK